MLVLAASSAEADCVDLSSQHRPPASAFAFGPLLTALLNASTGAARVALWTKVARIHALQCKVGGRAPYHFVESAIRHVLRAADVLWQSRALQQVVTIH